MVHSVGFSRHQHQALPLNFLYPQSSAAASAISNAFNGGLPGSAAAGASGTSGTSPSDSTQAQGSATDVSTAFQQFDAALKTALLQLQSSIDSMAASNADSSDKDKDGAIAAKDSPAASALTGQNASKTNNGASSMSSLGALFGQIHHHGAELLHASSKDVSSGDLSTLQTDVNKIVSDMMNMLQSFDTKNPNGTTDAAAANTNMTNTANTDASLQSASATTGGTSGNNETASSAQSVANIFTQDLLRAMQTYGAAATPTTTAA